MKSQGLNAEIQMESCGAEMLIEMLLYLSIGHLAFAIRALFVIWVLSFGI